MSHKINIFEQITQIIPRHEFEKSVRKHKGDFVSKGFSCWEQFISMLYAHFPAIPVFINLPDGITT